MKSRWFCRLPISLNTLDKWSEKNDFNSILRCPTSIDEDSSQENQQWGYCSQSCVDQIELTKMKQKQKAVKGNKHIFKYMFRFIESGPSASALVRTDMGNPDST